MIFREYECRIRKDHGAEIFDVVSHSAVNLLKKESSRKRGVKGETI